MVVYSQQCSKLAQPSWINFKLSGVGFRNYSYRQRLVLSIGYSHYLSLWLPQVKGRRQRIIIKKDQQQRLEELKYTDPYRHRGIQNLSLTYRTKEGKKR